LNQPLLQTDWVALTTLPTWLLWTAAMVLLGGLLLSFWATHGSSPRTRWSLLSLRALLAVLLMLLLMEPGQQERATEPIANRVVVVMDESASMNRDTPSRSVQAAKAAQQLVAKLQSSSPGLVVQGHAFSDALTPMATDQLQRWADGAAMTGTKTRLRGLAELPTLLGDTTRAPVTGVLLLSDGADTDDWTTLPTDVQLALQQLRRQSVPVHAVVLGTASKGRDVRLVKLRADEFSFVRNPMVIDATIAQRGFTGSVVTVVLREDGRAVAQTQLTLTDEEQKVSLKHEPQAVGSHVYSVVVEPVAEEEALDNNREDIAIQVIRDRIRVLQVAGRPSWDERFVRRLLKDNPSVDLISFFILRSTTDVSGAPNNEMSLIPFPTEELFTQQLHTFDVVIFQDFNYRPYGMAAYLEDVRKYVEGGGGFLMTGGELSFSDGEYDDTPVAEVLPVRLLPGRNHIDEDDFVPMLTEAGRRHPVTDLGIDPKQLPPLQGVNLVAGRVPGATTLLAHPSLTADGEAAPLLSVREVGKGRSMALLTDTTWMWGLPHVGAGGRGDAHRRLFANALRWLIRDPQLSRVKIAFEQKRAEPGQALPFAVRTYDDRYQPLAGGVIRGQVIDLEHDSTALPLTGISGDDGVWRGTFTPPGPGVYRVQVSASAPVPAGSAEGLALGSAQDIVVVRAATLETLHREPDIDRLRQLTDAAGGMTVDVDHLDDLVFAQPKAERVLRQQTSPLWDRWWWAVLIVAIASLEWSWRRQAGFA
jgi:uncharacterized membrane protein